MGVRRNFSRGATSIFCLSFLVSDDAMQIDVHKTLYPFYFTKKIPHVTVTVKKCAWLATTAR